MRDADIRRVLRKSHLSKFIADKESKVVNELGVGNMDAIIDMAVINGSLHGFEIKSEYDTLNRLPRQLSAYCKTFDYLTIISAKKHLPHLLNLLPNWCGIIIVGNKLKEYRKPKKNIDTDNYSVAQLLWKNEAIEILNECGIHKGIKYKTKQVLWSLLANSLDKGTLSLKVREKIKIRANWKFEPQLSQNDDYFQLSSKL
jgi:hypothetical protein